jgi:two-component system sensor histidine kinase VicK
MLPSYITTTIVFIGQNPVWMIAPATAIILTIGLINHILWRRLSDNEKLKYEFITIMAHKFRTPLTHIKWISEELAGTAQDHRTKEGMEQIRKAGTNLIGLTTTLLEVIDLKKEKGLYVFERTDLCDFVRTIGEGARRTFQEKNIFFSVVCADLPVFAKIDKSRMEFAIQVLMDNAFAYTPTGKKVEMAVGHVRRNATITVKDNGIGIRPEDMRKIFGKFFRANNARAMDTEGFGVGLYLAESVVEKHHGKLEAFSDGEGHGSTFRMVLRATK